MFVWFGCCYDIFFGSPRKKRRGKVAGQSPQVFLANLRDNTCWTDLAARSHRPINAQILRMKLSRNGRVTFASRKTMANGEVDGEVRLQKSPLRKVFFFLATKTHRKPFFLDPWDWSIYLHENHQNQPFIYRQIYHMWWIPKGYGSRNSITATNYWKFCESIQKGKGKRKGFYKNWKTQNCDCLENIVYHFLGNRGWF